MPPWTRFTCELWQKTLMRLEKGWYSVSSKLDWAVKLRLYEKKLQQWGYSFFKRDKPIKLSEERLFELLQYDLCCSRLGESGLFEQLDKKGCFDHHVTGVPKITNPTTFQKPVMGRAAIRAKIIEKLCKQKENTRFRAGWNYIMSSDGGKRLKLDDVDTNNTEWHTHKSKIPIQLINALKYLER